jgi:hypothetical protein
MAGDDTFEIHAQRNGRWTIENQCRTEEEAVVEARLLFERKQCTGVKVIKEAFDESTKLYRQQTVFRLSNSSSGSGGPGMSSGTNARATRNTSGGARNGGASRRSLLDLLKG